MSITPRQAAEKLRRCSEFLGEGVQEIINEDLNRRLEAAIKLSEGPYTLAMLRAMGHPYSARFISNPNTPRPLGMINFQSGEFRGSWRIIPATTSGKKTVGYLVNTSKQAGLLARGTRKMIARPYKQEIIRSSPRTNIEIRVRQGFVQAYRSG